MARLSILATTLALATTAHGRPDERGTPLPPITGEAFVVAESYVGEGWVENGYSGLTTWRVYVAECDGFDDGLLSVYGLSVPGFFPLRLTSSDGQFHNAEHDSLTAPEDLRFMGIWENQWDTYVTIGTDTAKGDITGLSPGFAEESGNLRASFVSGCIGWFVTPDEGECKQGICACTENRVLIAQLTVVECETVSGTVSYLKRTGQQRNGITFSSEAPPRCRCPADLDGDGLVGTKDLIAVLAAWGNKGGPEDLDGSGIVDIGDILAVLAAWGPCP